MKHVEITLKTPPTEEQLADIQKQIRKTVKDFVDTLGEEQTEKCWEDSDDNESADLCPHCHNEVLRREYIEDDDGDVCVKEYSYSYCPWCGKRVVDGVSTKFAVSRLKVLVSEIVNHAGATVELNTKDAEVFIKAIDALTEE